MEQAHIRARKQKTSIEGTLDRISFDAPIIPSVHEWCRDFEGEKKKKKRRGYWYEIQAGHANVMVIPKTDPVTSTRQE